MKNYLVIFLLLFYSSFAISQNNSSSLNVEQFLEIVRQYHPVVKLSNIGIQKSDADITIARGAFNPIISNAIPCRNGNIRIGIIIIRGVGKCFI